MPTSLGEIPNIPLRGRSRLIKAQTAHLPSFRGRRALRQENPNGNSEATIRQAVNSHNHGSSFGAVQVNS